MKNLLLFGFLTFFTFVYAKEPIEQESMGDAENFKVEKAVKEKSAGRTFAGDKAKKKKHGAVPEKSDEPMSEDSEVRYWKFQE